MNTNDLNTALYEKMAAEQDKFRDWLKSQPPEEVLNHAYEYTIREDIVMAMEELELTDAQAKALLESPSPLADVYRYFEKLETGYMDVIRDSIENRADDVCKAQEELRTAPLYPHSAAYASEHGEMAQYNRSYQANSACKEAIAQTISAHYAENRLDTEAAVKDVLEKFGTERVQFILANTIQRKNYDGRISQDNKACCPGHGLGLHPLLRRSLLLSYPDNTGHKSAWPVSPAEPLLRCRVVPAAVFPPGTFPASGASSGPHFQCRCRCPESNAPYSDTFSGHRQLLHARWHGSPPAHLLLLLQSDHFCKHRDISP